MIATAKSLGMSLIARIGNTPLVRIESLTAHLPGVLIPVAGANHFTIMHELRDQEGVLTRQLPLLLP